MASRCFWLTTIAFACLPALAAGQEFPVPAPFQRIDMRDALGRDVVAWHMPADTARGLALFVQGSGCTSHFRRRPDGAVAGGYAAVLARVAAGRIDVLAVEKPGVMPGDDGNGGLATGCSQRFLAEHTLDRWVAALDAAVRAALRAGGPPRVVAIGHSEGAAAVARLAARNPAVTHLALLSPGGPTPLADLVARARRRGEPLTAIERQAAQIRARPDRIDEFAWGHPFRRWGSFLDAPLADDLRATTAALLLVHGTADATLPVESFDVLAAELAAAERPALVERLDGADHALNLPGEAAPAGLARQFARVLDWALR